MIKTKVTTKPLLIVLFTTIIILVVSILTAFADTEKAKENFNKALTYEKNGDLDGALIAYQTCLAEDPNYVDAYINIGSIYFTQKDYEKALENFKTAVEKDKNNVDAFANLGKVEYKLKKYAEAEAAFKSAIVLNDTSTSLYRELGKIYLYKKKNYKKVVETFVKCHKLGGGDHLTYYMLGKAYHKQDKTTDAINSLNKSIELNKKYYNSRSTMGQIYLAKGKYSKAASAFKAAMKIDPKKYRAAYNYAIAVENINPEDYGTNIINWEKFINIARKNPKAKKDVAIAQQHVKELKDAQEKASLQ